VASKQERLYRSPSLLAAASHLLMFAWSLGSRRKLTDTSRPEATLLAQDVQIITHFLSPDTNPNGFAPRPLPVGSPTWQSSVDSSVVWAMAL